MWGLWGWLFSAAVFGVIVAFINEGEFPDWGPLLGSVMLMGIAGAAVAAVLPGWLWFVGTLASALVGAAMVSWFCHLPMRRSMIASGIYLGLGLVVGLLTRF